MLRFSVHASNAEEARSIAENYPELDGKDVSKLEVFLIPDKYWVGEALDWEAPTVPVSLTVELPFWIQVPDTECVVSVAGHDYPVGISSNHYELHAGIVSDSKYRCIYLGPRSPFAPESGSLQMLEEAQKANTGVLERKCKTVLRIVSNCNADVPYARFEDAPPRQNAAIAYLQAVCDGHIPVVNALIQRYRLATYDYFPYEVSAWDIPFWFITNRRSDDPDKHAGALIQLHPYRGQDTKPHITSFAHPEQQEPYELIDDDSLQQALALEPNQGEYDLLDAANLMERGDFTGAVRRTTTALEAIVESALRAALSKAHSEEEVDEKLYKSSNDVPGRVRQYVKLSKRDLPEVLATELEAIRDKRHKIVHSAGRIEYPDRHRAQKMIDFGRWLYNWFENEPSRAKIREGHIAKRSLGRAISIYTPRMTPGGVTVEPIGGLPDDYVRPVEGPTIKR